MSAKHTPGLRVRGGPPCEHPYYEIVDGIGVVRARVPITADGHPSKLADSFARAPDLLADVERLQAEAAARDAEVARLRDIVARLEDALSALVEELRGLEDSGELTAQDAQGYDFGGCLKGARAALAEVRKNGGQDGR